MITYLISLISNQFFVASTGLSILYFLKSIPFWIWSRIERLIYFSTTIEQEDTLCRYIDDWIKINMPNDLRRVEMTTKDDELNMTHENDYIFYWHKKRRIKIHKTKEKLENSAYTPLFRRSYTIGGLFARKAILELLKNILQKGIESDKLEKLNKKEISVYTITRHGYFSRNDGAIKHKNLDNIYLKDKDFLLEDLKTFKSQESLYQKLGIPFKRGYLFHGIPGNGKSSLAYAIAEYLKYDIYIVDLACTKKDDFGPLISSIPSGSLLLVEDIDNFYKLREPAKDNTINFSSFLNTLSGVAQKNNVITVITTNKIEDIDDALLRAGRCDVVLELLNPTKEIVEQYLSDIFEQEVVLESLKDLSFVKVQEIVLSNINDLEKIKEELK